MGLFAKTFCINCNQIGIAALEPVSFLPSGLSLSFPTHTPVTNSGVYPTNHAST